jgi:hypothetical protein
MNEQVKAETKVETKVLRTVKPISVEALETCRELLETLPTEKVMFNQERDVVELTITGRNTFKVKETTYTGSDEFFKQDHISNKVVLLELVKGKGKHSAPYNLFTF